MCGAVAYLLICATPAEEIQLAIVEHSPSTTLSKHVTSSQTLKSKLEKQIFNDDNESINKSWSEPGEIPELPILRKSPNEIIPLEKRNTHMLTVNVPSGGRLGNLMFAYASMCGIAARNYMIPTLDYNNILFNYFNITARPLHDRKISWPVYTETAPYKYSQDSELLNYNLDLQMYGFFQSWKYFEDIKGNIRKQFTFTDIILQSAISFLREVREAHFPHKQYAEQIASEPLRLVGIHVRRGDLLEWDNQDMGYSVATASYLDNAMSFFEAKYPHLIFIVCSDDIPWSRVFVRQKVAPVVFSETFSAIQDMAVLSLCNHSIITVGSFGWWSAWLAGGTTLYFNQFPKKYSWLSHMFSAKDYYPSHWKGLY